MTISKKELQARIEKTKAEARKRVIKRGIIHFRCDEEMMEQLLQVSSFKKIPVSVLVRSWMAEHLRKEFPKILNC